MMLKAFQFSADDSLSDSGFATVWIIAETKKEARVTLSELQHKRGRPDLKFRFREQKVIQKGVLDEDIDTQGKHLDGP